MNEHECKYGQMIQEMHNEICGTSDHPKGFRVRIQDLEDWRNASTTRVKNRAAWLYGVLGACIVKLLDLILPQRG